MIVVATAITRCCCRDEDTAVVLVGKRKTNRSGEV